VLYVGDDPTCDVVGARAAGLRTAWMNRRSTAWPDGLSAADLVVRDCAELVQKLNE
jgi:FMN phosphatase YigB (HAD superfamily)